MENAGEKSQDPTPHRRQQAREEGQVVHSQDLAAAALLTVGLVVLLWLGAPTGYILRFVHPVAARRGLAFDRSRHVDGLLVGNVLGAWPRRCCRCSACMLLPVSWPICFRSAFCFCPTNYARHLARVSPLTGFAADLLAGERRAAGVWAFQDRDRRGRGMVEPEQPRGELLGLATLELPQIAGFMTDVLLWTSIKVCVALFILALLDYLYQYWRHEQELRMTQQEVREEMKNLQGDPEVIARRRNVQRQMAMNRLKSAVPKADVVVTNPTELAVAIQYDIETMAAPIVVAKGAGVIAAQIRRLALENGIPIIEKKPLAQVLYKEVELNHPIPDKMYAAVAEVLAYVYQLKRQAAEAKR